MLSESKNIFLVGLFVFICMVNIFAEEWIEFTSSTPEEPFIENFLAPNVSFSVEVFGMYSTNISENGTVYQRVTIPDWFVLEEIGKPEIPVIRLLVAIPECDSATLTDNVFNEMTFDNYHIYPAPDYEEVQNPDGSVYLAEVFTKNDSAYNTDQFFPEVTAEIKEIAYIRDQKIAEVWIYPVQFNPVTHQIRANTYYEIELNFVNPTSSVNVNTGIFSNVCQNTLLNYTLGGRGASDNVGARSRGTVEWITVNDTLGLITADYLIITADDFFDINNHNTDIESLANHRAAYNGFDVAVVNVDDVMSIYPANPPFPIYDNEEKIRNFVRSVYENGTAYNTGDGSLAYVLLMGDTKGEDGPEPMPTSYDGYYSYHYASDYYFSCVTDTCGNYDDYGDLFIGRLCSGDTLELHNFVTRTINYEDGTYFSNWKESVLLTAGNITGAASPSGINDLFNEIESMIPANFDVTQIKRYELPSVQATRDSNIAVINQGIVWTNYIGHGWMDFWSEAFYQTDFNSLNNGEKQPFVISVACQTGHFDQNSTNDCMAEYFTNDIDKGSIGFLGASRNAGALGGPRFSRYLNNAFWGNESHIGGEFVLEGKILIGVSYRYNFNYFGDPALYLMAGYDSAKTPENIIITESADNVYINWDESEGATGYNIYSSDDPYIGFQLIDTVLDTNWSFSVSSDKKYYYVTSVRDVSRK